MNYTFGQVTDPKNLEKLEQRRMTPEEYESYKAWITSVKEKMVKSKENFKTPVGIHEITDERILWGLGYENVKYGSSNLMESGCAVFCIEYIQRVRGQEINIEDFAAKVAELEYYEPGRGTWHHLLDRLGAKRITNVNDIVRSLNNNKVVTILIPGHFINLVGYENSCFLVEDSKEPERQKIPCEEIISNANIIWYWK